MHTILYRTTRGRLGGRLVGNDMLLLTTRGRKTGRSHTVPLLYLQDGEVFVVIASWGGRDRHPEWYLNLVDHPDAEVDVGGEKRRVRARTAGPTERADWWRRAVDAYDGYTAYQGRTDREIPIVFLKPD